MSPVEGAWFEDESEIESVLRAGYAERESTPEIPGYTDLTEVGRGGQATVYKAIQTSTRRDIALKVFHDLPGGSAPALRRFEREIDLVSALDHPAIVTLHDGGLTADGRPYLVMELVRGRALDDCDAVRASRDAPGDPEAARAVVRLLREIASAVSHAHLRGVIHRDLKPANILVDEEGRPHVLDFGLARLTADGETNMTRSADGSFSGSLPWASPEQARGEQLDVRSDVYSLGVVFYETLAGVPPYDLPDGLAAALAAVADPRPRRLGAVGRDIDADLEAIVMRCLSAEPERRYQSGGELARDVDRYLEGAPIEARRDSTWYVLGRRIKRSRRALIVAGIVVVALAAALVVSQNALEAARDASTREAEKSRQLTDALGAARTAGMSEARKSRELEIALEAAREASRREAEKVEQTLNALRWVVAMIESVDPDAHGEDARLVDILTARSELLDEEFADDADSRRLLRGAFARVYEKLGRFADAEREYRKLHEDMVVIRGASHRDVLVGRANLQRMSFYLRRDSGDIAATEEIVAALEKSLGKTDYDTILATDLLAAQIRAAGDADRAGLIWRELLDRLPADFDPGRAALMEQCLASVAAMKGDLEAAIGLQERVVERLREHLGPDRARTLTAEGDLAYYLTDFGRLEEAGKLYAELEPRMIAKLGASHPNAIMVVENHAKLLQDSGRREEAAERFERVLKARTEKFGAEHPQTLVTLSNLAIVRSLLGDTEGATDVHRRVLEIRRRISPPHSFEMINALNSYAAGLCLLGRADEALPLHRDAVARADAAFGREHWADATFRVMLANCLLALEKFDEAEEVADDARAVLVDTLGAKHGNTLSAEDVLRRLEDARSKAAGER